MRAVKISRRKYNPVTFSYQHLIDFATLIWRLVPEQTIDASVKKHLLPVTEIHKHLRIQPTNQCCVLAYLTILAVPVGTVVG